MLLTMCHAIFPLLFTAQRREGIEHVTKHTIYYIKNGAKSQDPQQMKTTSFAALLAKKTENSRTDPAADNLNPKTAYSQLVSTLRNYDLYPLYFRKYCAIKNGIKYM